MRPGLSVAVRIAAGLLSLAGSAIAASPSSVFSASARWAPAPPGPGASARLEVTVAVASGWHVNSNAPLDPYLIPTAIRVDLPPGWRADPPVFPAHRLVTLSFSDKPVAVFTERFVVTLTLHAGPAPLPARLAGTVEAQACNDSLCMPPADAAFTVAVAAAAVPTAAAAGAPEGAPPERPAPPSPLPGAASAPAASDADAGAPSGRFASSGLLLQLLLVFVAGLALNLTPCVYPLIPITVGFFVAQKGASRRTTWALAAAYVLGMSATYTALGVAAALTGRLFGSALQNPWVVGLVVVVLLALAASMFGLWELRVPAWATRASGGRTGAAGAFVMGLAVGLVAAPCIGPFVLGLLTYVGQRQDVTLGFALFFALSLGLGLPYLFLAVSSGALERLPNSGAWMLGVRQLFGVVLVALAAYFAAPLLPGAWGWRLVAGLLAAGGAYLLVVARPGHEQPWVDRFMRLASAALLVAGVLLYPASRETSGPGVSWPAFDQSRLDAALREGRTVVLDFAADWCVPCRELDEKTFSDPAVAGRLAGLERFKVDLTASTPAAEALRSRYAVAGVPTLLFLRSSGEIPGTRLTGFEPPEAFLRRLARVLGG